MDKNKLEKILKKRITQQCEGYAKSTNKRCLQIASVGSIFCSCHGGGKIPRYIRPRDYPALLEELYEEVSSNG